MEKSKQEKMIIYQVFPRWFGNGNATLVKNGSIMENGVGKFSAFTPLALSKIKELGVTHVWYTGVIEHATQTDYTAYQIQKDHAAVVKGKAGSPYAIKDYYDVDPDLADQVPNRMAEFEALVERTHQAGLGVILDFVPNHVAREYKSDAHYNFISDLGEHDNTSKAFDPNNNFYYIPGQPLTLPFTAEESDGDMEYIEYAEFPAKATGNDHFDAYPGKNDWYETVKLNYGVDYLGGHRCYFTPTPNTWFKMLDILLFWAGKGIEGFRCDMAEMVPVEFWAWAIPRVKEQYPKIIFIAEIYNPGAYRAYLAQGHFDYLYDKVGLYDTLRAVTCGSAPADHISGCWKAVEGIQGQMLNFLENHDEQRLASDFYAKDGHVGIAPMMVAAWMNTNPVMIYSGQELGERGMDEEGFSGRDGRTTIFDYWSVESIRQWRNGGSFDGVKLSPTQRALREMYARILTIARDEPAITRGGFYDLMYANEKNRFFNNRNQYAFIRYLGKDIVIIVVNFSRSEQKVWVHIPQEAMDKVGIKDNAPARQINLLTGEETISTLTTVWPFKVTLPPCSGQILKFVYDL